ncbi:hypothetical protein [Azospirillum sp.]|uniref:hypothetical protein n=1 Tax=Azospirillum sp. TaxID=34012 RepID=UPI002D661791|nr:hypothetical protein [Azospirillum sp.]HYD70009.1 hypothetical protein [Azospirillum sp.]
MDMPDDLKGLLIRLLDRIEAVAADVSQIKADVSQLKADVTHIKFHHGERLSAIDARLDEQRQTINALIPTRIAAVPPAAE